MSRNHWFSLYTKICLTILMAILCIAPQAALRAWAQAVPESPAGQTAAEPQTASPSAPAPAAAVSPDDVVLTVGDVKITAKEFEALTRYLPPEVANAMPSLGKKGFAERYANLLGLAKEGGKRQVDQSEPFRQMMSFQRLMLLAQLTVNQLITTMGAVSPDEISYFYTAHQPDFQQLKLRGIYIPFSAEADSGKAGTPPAPPASQAKSKQPPTPAGKPKLTEAEARAKAEALRNRISAGEDMAALAKKESDHPTASQGGDFGFVRRSQFTPQIDNVIFALELKQISIPVRDRFGYFIFQVEEKRTQPLEEVKPVIENGLRQQKLGEALSKVQAEYPVIYNPRYFGEPAPAPPSMPAAPSAPAAPPK